MIEAMYNIWKANFEPINKKQMKVLMNLLIFKTDVNTKENARYLYPVLNEHPAITSWSVDFEDIDKVLRIETTGSLSENEVISIMANSGFKCEVLTH